MSTFCVIPNIMTNIIKIGGQPAISHAIKLLNSGGVIALPTDTIYGIACDATNMSAIKKLYSIKHRDKNKPLAICLGRISDIGNWAMVNHLPEGLLNKLLPGPVTLIFDSLNKRLDNSLICSGKVGIRIPNYDFIRNISTGLGVPLALTSANLSAEPSSVRVEEFKVLWHKLDGIFDGGTLNDQDIGRSGSTIVDLSEFGFYRIVRDGMALKNTCRSLEEFGLRPKT